MKGKSWKYTLSVERTEIKMLYTYIDIQKARFAAYLRVILQQIYTKLLANISCT